jgi:hypothetical protein
VLRGTGRIDTCHRSSSTRCLRRQSGTHGRSPILGDVFVQQDACLSIAQQPRQRRLPVEKREIAQILAIMLDNVEGIEDLGSSGLTTGQLLEPELGGLGRRRACQSAGCHRASLRPMHAVMMRSARTPVDMWTTQETLPTYPQAQQSTTSINLIVQKAWAQTQPVISRRLSVQPVMTRQQ